MLQTAILAAAALAAFAEVPSVGFYAAPKSELCVKDLVDTITVSDLPAAQCRAACQEKSRCQSYFAEPNGKCRLLTERCDLIHHKACIHPKIQGACFVKMDRPSVDVVIGPYEVAIPCTVTESQYKAPNVISCGVDAGSDANKLNTDYPVTNDTFYIRPDGVGAIVVGFGVCEWSQNLTVRCSAATSADVWVHFGPSQTQKTCVTPDVPVFCDDEAANNNLHLNKDGSYHWLNTHPKTAAVIPDSFVVTAEQGQVCVTRTDLQQGWGQDLNIRCFSSLPAPKGAAAVQGKWSPFGLDIGISGAVAAAVVVGAMLVAASVTFVRRLRLRRAEQVGKEEEGLLE